MATKKCRVIAFPQGDARQEKAKRARTKEKPEIFIRQPEDIFNIVSSWGKRKQENFLVVTLNAAHKVIKIHHITKGLINRTIVHPRECFCPTIKDLASAVVFVHNHPSGSVSPSYEDEIITKRLTMAGSILGINVLDHLVISKNNFFSFRKEGKLETNNYEKKIDALIAEK